MSFIPLTFFCSTRVALGKAFFPQRCTAWDKISSGPQVGLVGT